MLIIMMVIMIIMIIIITMMVMIMINNKNNNNNSNSDLYVMKVEFMCMDVYMYVCSHLQLENICMYVYIVII